MTSGGPAAQPSRTPGKKVLENVPICTTDPLRATTGSDGAPHGRGKKPSSRYATFSTISTPVAPAQFDGLCPAGGAKAVPAGVLVIGDRVEQLGAQATVEQLCERSDIGPVGVGVDTVQRGFEGCESCNGTEVARRLNQHHVGEAERALGDQRDRVDAAAAAGDRQCVVGPADSLQFL